MNPSRFNRVLLHNRIRFEKVRFQGVTKGFETPKKCDFRCASSSLPKILVFTGNKSIKKASSHTCHFKAIAPFSGEFFEPNVDFKKNITDASVQKDCGEKSIVGPDTFAPAGFRPFRVELKN